MWDRIIRLFRPWPSINNYIQGRRRSSFGKRNRAWIGVFSWGFLARGREIINQKGSTMYHYFILPVWVALVVAVGSGKHHFNVLRWWWWWILSSGLCWLLLMCCHRQKVSHQLWCVRRHRDFSDFRQCIFNGVASNRGNFVSLVFVCSLHSINFPPIELFSPLFCLTHFQFFAFSFAV